MTDLEQLGKIDPAWDLAVSDEAYEELRRHIVTTGAGADIGVGRRSRRARRTIVSAAVAACLVVVATFAVAGPSRPPTEQPEAWHVVNATAPLPFESTSPQGTVDAGQAGLLTCPTADVCYLLTSAPGASRPPFWTVAFVTTNGGRVWRATAALPTDATFTAPLTCFSASHCLAPGTLGGDAVFSFSYDPGPASPVLFTTTNAGASWQTLSLPSSAGFITALSCATATFCLASSVVSGHHATALPVSETSSLGGAIATWPTVATHILRTGDAGHTWTILKDPVRGSVFDFQCLDASTCSGLGVPDHPGGAPLTSYVSDNGGTSWTAKPLPGRLTRYAYSIECFVPDSCVAFDSNNINSSSTFLSSDQGRTWTAQPSPEGLRGLTMRAFSCSDTSHCWGVAANQKDSLILATADGGVTWKVAATGTRLGSFTNIACVVNGACTALESTPQGTVTLTNGS